MLLCECFYKINANLISLNTSSICDLLFNNIFRMFDKMNLVLLLLKLQKFIVLYLNFTCEARYY